MTPRSSYTVAGRSEIDAARFRSDREGHDFRPDMRGVRLFVPDAARPGPPNPVVGAGAISVAVAPLTVDGPTTIGVREIARVAGMNTSTISRTRSKLIDAALSEPDGSPLPMNSSGRPAGPGAPRRSRRCSSMSVRGKKAHGVHPPTPEV